MAFTVSVRPARRLEGHALVDPGTGFDGVADLLIRDGVVAALGSGLLAPEDANVVDVSDLIVGPGFVDVHGHVHSVAGQRLQALDGVTTALDLEARLMPIEKAYADAAREGRPLNYGFSASWGAARAQVMGRGAP
jgi:predicted amidohydrolase YtcJ